MASVTGITATRAEEIYNASIIGGEIDENGQLLLITRGGTIVNAGAIIAPKAAVEKAHPVGSIFIATVPTNPGNQAMLGVGTWVRWGQGKIPLSQIDSDADFNTAEETGGNKSLTLSAAQLPAHVHSIPAHTHSIALTYDKINVNSDNADAGRVTEIDFGTARATDKTGTTGASAATNSGSIGDGAAIDILPPYIIAYFWKRTG